MSIFQKKYIVYNKNSQPCWEFFYYLIFGYGISKKNFFRVCRWENLGLEETVEQDHEGERTHPPTLRGEGTEDMNCDEDSPHPPTLRRRIQWTSFYSKFYLSRIDKTFFWLWNNSFWTISNWLMTYDLFLEKTYLTIIINCLFVPDNDFIIYIYIFFIYPLIFFISQWIVFF